jgi:hypothetical protein
MDINEAVEFVLDNSSEDELKSYIMDLLFNEDVEVEHSRKLNLVDGHFDEIELT